MTPKNYPHLPQKFTCIFLIVSLHLDNSNIIIAPHTILSPPTNILKEEPTFIWGTLNNSGINGILIIGHILWKPLTARKHDYGNKNYSCKVFTHKEGGKIWLGQQDHRVLHNYWFFFFSTTNPSCEHQTQ